MGPQDNDDERQHLNDGASGEGAGSALEAMLRKRQMRVDPQPDPAAATSDQEQDGQPAKEYPARRGKT